MEIVIPRKFNDLNTAGRNCLTEVNRELSDDYPDFKVIVTDMKHNWSVTVALFKNNRRFVTFSFNSLTGHEGLLWKIITEIEHTFPKEPRPQRFMGKYPPQ